MESELMKSFHDVPAEYHIETTSDGPFDPNSLPTIWHVCEEHIEWVREHAREISQEEISCQVPLEEWCRTDMLCGHTI